MTTAGAATVDAVIKGPSTARELLAVVRAAAAITFGVWLYLVNSPFVASARDGAKTGTLAPYQAFIRDRPDEDSRMFRNLQVALLEAEAARSIGGTWPTAEALAADGVEPFALNPALKGPRYNWRQIQSGRIVNYLGVPRESRAPAWLILIQEPDPAAPEVFRADEEHHQLVDGSVLHVSIWSLSDSMRAPETLTPAPQFAGWTELFAVAPSTAHTGAIALPPSVR